MSRTERIETMDNISLILKRKRELQSKVHYALPTIQKRIEASGQRLKESLAKLQEINDANVSED